jgi:putative spermidine/putrescine transport system substrate-binding protein
MWNDSWAARGAKDGVWAQINTSNMADSQNIIQQLNPPSGFGIAHGITPFGISYSPKYVSAPKSWTDLLDPKYKGKVAMWDVFFDWLIMEARILGGDEHNLQPAFGAWAKVKDNIGMWIQDFPFLYQALDSGQIWLAPDWGSWSSSAKASGTSVEFTIPQEGATQASAILEISAGLTPQMQTLTEKFYNYYLTSDFQVAQMRQTYYSPTRQGVNIPSDLASNPAIITAQDALSKLVRYDYAYVGAHFTDISNAISQQLK